MEPSALPAFHVLQNGLHPLLKIAPVLGARQHGRHVQGHDPLPAQALRRVSPGHPQGQAFGHGGLAYPGLPDEHRVILAAAGEDLGRPSDLVSPAHHWVQLPRRGQGGQIPAVLVQHPGVRPADASGGAQLLPVPGDRVAEDGRDVGIDVVQIRALAPEDPGAAAVRLAQDAQQQMLCADKALTQMLRLGGGGLHRLAGVLGEPQHRPAGEARAVHLPHRLPQPLRLQPPAQQDPGAQTLALRQDAQQQVLRAHAAVAQVPGAEPGLFDGGLRPLGKLFIASHALPPAKALGFLPLSRPGPADWGECRGGKKRSSARLPEQDAGNGNYLHIFWELTVWPKEAIDFWKRCATMMPQTAEKGQIHTKMEGIPCRT